MRDISLRLYGVYLAQFRCVYSVCSLQLRLSRAKPYLWIVLIHVSAWQVFLGKTDDVFSCMHVGAGDKLPNLFLV